MGKKHPYYRKSMSANFPVFPHSMVFAEFSNAMGNLMRKTMHFPCDEQYHTIEWESNGKKHP